ncbi:MAG: SUMF1/EgtB/PvdO family nonheme iron enzyme, partial [Sediminibacterium sp.]|nr:SUMF1/EgtB/PvdO family nonheme iron enzyme [Sediminibacterium sp.]
QNRTTPMVVRDLMEGDYQVEIKKQGYNNLKKNITVLDEQTTKINETLINTQKIKIETQPNGAIILLNNTIIGISPLEYNFSLNTNYTLTAKKTDYEEYTQTLNINENTNNINIQLKATTKKIKIETQPDGATILLNNTIIGISPLEIDLKLNTTYTLTAKKTDYEDYTQTLNIDENSENLNIQLKSKNKIFDDIIESEMVYVEGGTFTMGCTTEQGTACRDDGKPAHVVTLSSFYMGKYEVTQALWYKVMGNNPSDFKDCDDCPVENVSWYDCQKFITKLNKLTGKQYRLPTEAEWEYVARGGNKSKGYKYSGSDNLDAVAWYHDNSGNKTHRVGTKQANELGIFDMSGNVEEWCNDWFNLYNSSDAINPTGPRRKLSNRGSEAGRILRGGYFSEIRFNDDISLSVSNRETYVPSLTFQFLGFRLVR